MLRKKLIVKKPGPKGTAPDVLIFNKLLIYYFNTIYGNKIIIYLNTFETMQPKHPGRRPLRAGLFHNEFLRSVKPHCQVSLYKIGADLCNSFSKSRFPYGTLFQKWQRRFMQSFFLPEGPFCATFPKVAGKLI